MSQWEHGIWRDREEVESYAQPDLVESMIQEANGNGYEPADLNDEGIPNIYFRGKFIIERDGEPVNEFVSDGYWMFIQPKQG